MKKAELKEVLEAMEGFQEYVEEYSDPVIDEDRFLRFKRAKRFLKKKLKPRG